jgi:pilus assembly protein CpaB
VALRWIGQRTELASVKVVIASQDLPFGTELREGMLTVIDWPAAAQLKDPVADPKTVYQRIINAPLMRGEPVLAAKLAAQGEKAGLSAVLHEGTRAVTVKVNEIVGVAGFALPGNYVDVMVHARQSNEQPVSKIVLERILVLALAQDASTSETKPRVVNAVTLEVTPEQAEQIDLARSVGALSLVLRSQVDMGRVATAGARMNDLFPVPAVLPTAAAVKATPIGKPVSRMRTRESLPAAPATPPVPVGVPQDKLEVIRGTKKTLE